MTSTPTTTLSPSASGSGAYWLSSRTQTATSIICLSLALLGIAACDLRGWTNASEWLSATTLFHAILGMGLGATIWGSRLQPQTSTLMLTSCWIVLWLNTMARLSSEPGSGQSFMIVLVLAGAGWCMHSQAWFWGTMSITLPIALGMMIAVNDTAAGIWALPLGLIFGWRTVTFRVSTARQWGDLQTRHQQALATQQAMLTSLQANEERFRILSETVPAGVFITDETGAVSYTNTAWRRITGTTFRDAAVTDWTQYLHPEDRSAIREEWHRTLQDGDTFERECRLGSDNTSPRWVYIRSCPNYTDAGTTYVGMVEEITQRKLAAEEARRYAEHLQETQQKEARNARHLSQVAAELEEARKSAVAETRAKSEFLARMSHEIRTPMTAVLGYTDVLLEQTAHQSGLQDALLTIKRNGEYLVEIINDILDLSKIEAGKLDVEYVRCSPQIIAQDVLSLMQIPARSKNLQLIKAVDEPFPQSMETDPTRLRQILLNLVGNAIKFTTSGNITVGLSYMAPPAEHDTGTIRLTVRDTGVGMTAEQMTRIFRPFTQAESSTTRQFGGTGLGLTICKRFAELMGGDILVESTSGSGSIFTVVLPARGVENVAVLPEEPVPAAATTVVVPPTALISQAIVTVPADGTIPYRVLVAEDGPDNQKLIHFVLKKAGAMVTMVENGQLAIDAVEHAITHQQPYDIVLMDMSMPVLDGYAATRQLRERGHHLPIVALTAHAMSSDRDKCLDAGCNDYATKPLNRSALLETIRCNVEQHRAAAQTTIDSTAC